MSEETQLDLFREYQLGGQSHLTRIIPFWDLLPLYLFAPQTEVPGDTPISKLPRVSHTFEAHGEQITVDVTPAILAKDSALARIIFPGEREQMVAAAIRALAIRQQATMSARSTKDGQILITVAFTVRQLRAELERTGHTLSHAEVMEALEILSRAVATITRSRSGQEPIAQPTTYFYSFQQQGDKYIVTLNVVESQQIIAGAYRALDYAQLMELPDPIARWIYQYIHAEHGGAKKPGTPGAERGFDIPLELLITRGLISKRLASRLRDAIPRVRSALDLLAQVGVLHVTAQSPGYEQHIETTSTGGRSKITGANWKLFVSAKTVDFIIEAHIEAKPRKPQFQHLTVEERLAHSRPAREELTKR